MSIKHHTFNTVKITFLFRDRDRSVPLLSNAVTFAFLGVQLCPAFISVLLMLWSFQRVLERSITVIERSGTAIKSKGHFRTPRDARITGLEKTGNGMVTVMEQKRYLHCSIGIYGKMTESVRYYTIWYTARNTVLIFALLSSCFQEIYIHLKLFFVKIKVLLFYPTTNTCELNIFFKTLFKFSLHYVYSRNGKTSYAKTWVNNKICSFFSSFIKKRMCFQIII